MLPPDGFFISFTKWDTELLFSDKLKANLPNFEDWTKPPNNGYRNRLYKTNIWVKKEELNSLNFRSDEFTKNHEGLHVVFSGCSNTWGTGLFENEIWANKVYNLISKQEKCSGYFNLAILGSSLQSQIFNLFKYFKEYGNPNVIFINFPDLLRSFMYDQETNGFYDAIYKKNSKEILNLISFQYYFMLDQYCKSNNIKLYSFSWIESKYVSYTDKIIEVPLDSFDSYFKINSKEIFSYLNEQKSTDKKNKFLEIARDDEHPGIAFHDYWSNFIYNKYITNQ
jgi:hypothetical protein